MLDKSLHGKEKTRFSKGVITGAVIGGILGAVTAFLYHMDALPVPGLRRTYASIPIDATITGTVLGVIAGGGMVALVKLFAAANKDAEYASNRVAEKNTEQVIEDTDMEAKLQLLEEQLGISKEWIQTGEVTVHKEISTEEKNVTVSVDREELVICKRVLDKENLNNTNEYTETLRIPIMEEHIEIVKHPVILEDVKVYTHRFEENMHMEETLKKEKLHIETTGNVTVADDETEKHP